MAVTRLVNSQSQFQKNTKDHQGPRDLAPRKPQDTWPGSRVHGTQSGLGNVTKEGEFTVCAKEFTVRAANAGLGDSQEGESKPERSLAGEQARMGGRAWPGDILLHCDLSVIIKRTRTNCSPRMRFMPDVTRSLELGDVSGNRLTGVLHLESRHGNQSTGRIPATMAL